MRERRADIEAAKGLAIILVVFGHLVARQDPAGVQWYEPLRRAVYAFHMPFFLYLSGFVAAYSGFLHQRRAAIGRLAIARAQRLLVPFFGLGVLIVLAKSATAGHFYIDNVPASLPAGLRALVWDTGHSPALFIWYLFVLFVVSLMAVLALDGAARRLPWLLALALGMFWLPLPPYFYLDRVGMFAPFFLMGGMAGLAGTRWDGWVDRFWPRAMLAFGISLLAVAWFDTRWYAVEKPVLLVAGTLSLPAIHGFVRNLPLSWLQQIFLRLGRYCFMIYLFNTLFIGLAKGALLQAWPWDGGHFIVLAAVLMSAGLIGPVLLKRYIFRHVRLLDRMTD